MRHCDIVNDILGIDTAMTEIMEMISAKNKANTTDKIALLRLYIAYTEGRLSVDMAIRSNELSPTADNQHCFDGNGDRLHNAKLVDDPVQTLPCGPDLPQIRPYDED